MGLAGGACLSRPVHGHQGLRRRYDHLCPSVHSGANPYPCCLGPRPRQVLSHGAAVRGPTDPLVLAAAMGRELLEYPRRAPHQRGLHDLPPAQHKMDANPVFVVLLDDPVQAPLHALLRRLCIDGACLAHYFAEQGHAVVRVPPPEGRARPLPGSCGRRGRRGGQCLWGEGRRVDARNAVLGLGLGGLLHARIHGPHILLHTRCDATIVSKSTPRRPP